MSLFATVLFTDVVESSANKRHASLGASDAVRDRRYLTEIQEPYYRLIRKCAAIGGHEVVTRGDSFYLMFLDPVLAVRCAGRIQQMLSRESIPTPTGPLRLRIGVHTGSVMPFDNGFQGTNVDRAARIEGIAAGGQILLSQATYNCVRSAADLDLVSRGEFHLKGIAHDHLYELNWGGRRQEATAV